MVTNFRFVHAVKKVGRKGIDNISDIKGMAGAPRLEVQEVKKMKITLRPAFCEGRPEKPNTTNHDEDAWPNAPKGNLKD